ncbi:MAG TPA: DNA replication and repair protein RecF [Gemmatimonadales bacterium]|nr:DNA replication and repair protein RecF [Gemmatimonadales bacterium]
MRLLRLVARGFRNLAPADLQVPERGLALLGPNGAGKTNLLEAVYYSVLFRSFRGATDAELAGFGADGFAVEVEWGGSPARTASTTYHAATKEKRVRVDGVPERRLQRAAGQWLAVAFLPTDTALAAGPPSGRRQYLDRLLSLSDPAYLGALSRYRAALAQRNAALRQGQLDPARAFEPSLSEAGAELVRARIRWSSGAGTAFAAEFEGLGEAEATGLGYSGRVELADVGAWGPLMREVEARDRARGMTTVGPHRDDLRLTIGGRPLRDFGSTGQQRSAAIALKLLELGTLRAARGEEPALILDDVFAELDRDRQQRLAARLTDGGVRQALLSAPRPEEIPANLGLPVWRVDAGRVTAA